VKRLVLVGLSIFASSGLAVSRALAQNADSPAPTNNEPAEGGVQEILVTGTRIVRPGFDAPTPLTALSSNDLAAANPGGPVDALRQLPVLAFSTGPRGATGSAGNGQSYLNLRNLGGNRTLVLLDGNRFVPTSGNGTASGSDVGSTGLTGSDRDKSGSSTVAGSGDHGAFGAGASGSGGTTGSGDTGTTTGSHAGKHKGSTLGGSGGTSGSSTTK